jgi:hypothetical protein
LELVRNRPYHMLVYVFPDVHNVSIDLQHIIRYNFVFFCLSYRLATKYSAETDRFWRRVQLSYSTCMAHKHGGTIRVQDYASRRRELRPALKSATKLAHQSLRYKTVYFPV